MYSPKTLFNIISFVALTVVGGVSAQDSGAGYVFNCTTPGQVALTFDDGPSPFTPKLLGFLAAANIHATFFVLGVSINDGDGKKTLKSAFDAGHQIALHSNTHADMNTLTPAKIKDEYEINLKAVQDTLGVSPKFARPPFGNCNAACAKVLQGEMGLTVTQWNCDSNDWRYENSVQDRPKTFTNIANIINPSNPKTDSFVTLQHDIKDYSVDLVPKIIDLIKSKGYNFVTVEQCLGGKIPAYVKAPGAPATSPAPASAPATSPAPAPASAPAPAAGPASGPAPASSPASSPAAGGAAGPGYLDSQSSPSPSASSSSNSTGYSSSAEKLTISTFSLTLICLALGLLY